MLEWNSTVVTKKLISFLSLLFILMLSAQAVTEQIIQDLNMAIEQSNKIKVQKLLLSSDFTLEELNNAYMKALFMYRKKDTFIARIAEGSIMPIAVLGISGGLAGVWAKMRNNFSIYRSKEVDRLTEELGKANISFDSIDKYEKFVLTMFFLILNHKDFKNRLAKLNSMMRKFLEEDSNVYDMLSRSMFICTATTVGSVCLCYWILGALKNARAIVVAIEAKMNQKQLNDANGVFCDYKKADRLS